MEEDISKEEISRVMKILSKKGKRVIDERYGLENHARMMANARWKKSKRKRKKKTTI